MSAILELQNIRKSYFGTEVLKGVSLDLAPGEIHALVGENGAGKSTLMNVLFGMPVIHETGGYQGTILLEGEPVTPTSPSEAMGYGIGMVHQEFMLLPGFTVTENIRLNREITRANPVSRAVNVISRRGGAYLESLDFDSMAASARTALDSVGLQLSEKEYVRTLPVGHMQFVEIAREVDKLNARVIVFDEPTAVLTESEAEVLMGTIRKLAAKGMSILFISHRLDEVLSLSDRITVLRDGEAVRTIRREEATAGLIAELMIGREVVQAGGRRAREESAPLLEVEDLRVSMPGEELRGLSAAIQEGEIFGVAGLAGQGKLGLANGIMGMAPAQGRVKWRGAELTLNDPRQVLADGMAFVSEDRRGVGLVLDNSIEENICLPASQIQGRFLIGSGPLAVFDRKAARAHARECIEMFDIRCTGPDQPVRRLSGGNQQKVCLAKAFTLNPKLLFVSEPTRGIDVGAKDRVLNLLTQINRENGVTVVVTSSELAELRRVCHRVAVVDKGTIAGILNPDAPDVEFGLLMGGQKQ